MNIRAQLLIDQYLVTNRDCLLDELYQSGLLTEAGPCAAVITHFAEKDVQGLRRVLPKDELAAFLQILQIHNGKPTANTIVYWVTFYLSIARTQNSGWALRCATHPDTLQIYCKSLKKLL